MDKKPGPFFYIAWVSVVAFVTFVLVNHTLYHVH